MEEGDGAARISAKERWGAGGPAPGGADMASVRESSCPSAARIAEVLGERLFTRSVEVYSVLYYFYLISCSQSL